MLIPTPKQEHILCKKGHIKEINNNSGNYLVDILWKIFPIVYKIVML